MIRLPQEAQTRKQKTKRCDIYSRDNQTRMNDLNEGQQSRRGGTKTLTLYNEARKTMDSTLAYARSRVMNIVLNMNSQGSRYCRRWGLAYHTDVAAAAHPTATVIVIPEKIQSGRSRALWPLELRARRSSLHEIARKLSKNTAATCMDGMEIGSSTTIGHM